MSRHRERERVTAILAQVDLPLLLLVGGGAGGRPPRLLAVPSNLGGWTFLQAEVGLSRIPAAHFASQALWEGKVRVQ